MGYNSGQTRPGDLSVPSFTGPWADWFTRIYSATDTTNRQRQILSDGVVDDSEYAELRDSFRQCLEDLGIAVTLEANGGFSVTVQGTLSESQVTQDAVPGCEKRTVGSVAMLYEQVRRNPERKDEFAIVVDCLKRDGIVGDSYTVAQYAKDIGDQTGLDWNSTEVRTCAQDPLGVLGAR